MDVLENMQYFSNIYCSIFLQDLFNLMNQYITIKTIRMATST